MGNKLADEVNMLIILGYQSNKPLQCHEHLLRHKNTPKQRGQNKKEIFLFRLR